MASHFIILLISISGLLTSCTTSGQTGEIEIAQKRWEAANIETYSADIERICFCPPPSKYTIVVDSDSLTKVINSETGEEIAEDYGYSTVDELFQWLLEAASRNPQKLELEFDDKLGYPTLIDYNQSDGIADEEMLIRILDLRQR